MNQILPSRPVADDVTPWARSFLQSTLDQWVSAVDNPTGLFSPHLDRQWRRTKDGPLTLVSQCRLIYNFCRGYEIFSDARYAEAALRGLSALEAYFASPQDRYRWAVTSQGTEADATPDAYGHAFCLLALATAARVFDDAPLARHAVGVWQYVRAAFTDSHGGLLWRLEGGGPHAWETSVRSQNPIMHMFEALMALHRVDPTGEALAGALRILTFVRSLADFGDGRLIEQYTPRWQPQPVERGGVINLGHAFEWAWLLSEWHGITGDAAALETGGSFLRTGLDWGLDSDGGVRESCDPSGRIVCCAKGLWEQCEGIRAITRYAMKHDRPELDAVVRRALDCYRHRFVDEEYGGVYADADTPLNTDKGNVWKLDYHTVGMCLELLGA